MILVLVVMGLVAGIIRVLSTGVIVGFILGVFILGFLVMTDRGGKIPCWHEAVGWQETGMAIVAPFCHPKS